MRLTPQSVVRSPFSASYATTGSFTYSIPPWCSHIDIILLGGGGGGGGGDTGWTFAGQGGYAGNWTIRTLVRGIDIPWSLTTIGISVGAGGAASSAGSSNKGGNGGNTVVSFTTPLGTTQNATATGGVGGNGGNNGGFSGEVGKSPGGGGGGGAGGTFGGGTGGMAGAAGAAFFYAYTQATANKYLDELDTSTNFTVIQSGSGIDFIGTEVMWNSANTDGNAMALWTSPVATSNQYISGTVGSVVTLRASALIFHCDTTYSGYYAVEFFTGNIRLVRTSGSWGSAAVTVIASSGVSPSSGGLIEAWNIGETFKVAYNGTEIISTTISGAVIGYPYFRQGFGMYRASSISSTRIASWAGGSADEWGKT